MSRRFKLDFEFLLLAAGLAALLAVRWWDGRRKPEPETGRSALTTVDARGLQDLMRRKNPTAEEQWREDSFARGAEHLDRVYNGPKPPPARATWVKRPLDDDAPTK